jgi:hypothetical protein
MAQSDTAVRAGYHGTTHEDRVEEEATRLGVERRERENISAATHPSNAAPEPTAFANTEGEPVTEDAAR